MFRERYHFLSKSNYHYYYFYKENLYIQKKESLFQRSPKNILATKTGVSGIFSLLFQLLPSSSLQRIATNCNELQHCNVESCDRMGILSVCIDVCKHGLFLSVCKHDNFACFYVCMYVYLYSRAYLCMYVCMYVCKRWFLSARGLYHARGRYARAQIRFFLFPRGNNFFVETNMFAWKQTFSQHCIDIFFVSPFFLVCDASPRFF